MSVKLYLKGEKEESTEAKVSLYLHTTSDDNIILRARHEDGESVAIFNVNKDGTMLIHGQVPRKFGLKIDEKENLVVGKAGDCL